MSLWRRFRRYRWSGYVFSLALILALTLLIDLLNFRSQAANASMIYLLAVLAIAVNYGGGPAVLSSLAAFVGLSFVFTESRYALAVFNPSDVLVMYTFLVISVSIGQLAALQRQRATDAQERERQALLLGELGRVLVTSDLDQAATSIAARLRDELGLSAAVVEVNDQPFLTASARVGDATALALARAPAQQVVPGKTSAGMWRKLTGWLAGDPDFGEPGRGLRLETALLDAAGREIGGITLLRAAGARPFKDGDNGLLRSVAAQLSLVCEREWLRREATESEILRRSDDLKTALLRAVSHDLRTPLASILAASGSLLENEVSWSEEEQREFAETIKIGAERLNQIVANLLDLSRIESGSLKPQKDWYELWVLVDDVLARLRPALGGHKVVVDVPDDLPLVALDYVEISEVLVNLLENAGHYTPPDTEITVTARASGAWLEVAVSDRGWGVPEGELTRLFQPFYRLDPHGQRPQGAGLGLAVAKGLVEAHDGRIWAENQPGGGARFVFSLPLAAPEQLEMTGQEVRL
jgi:two-component system, OmpR family, sensor histidine kinase KdpD